MYAECSLSRHLSCRAYSNSYFPLTPSTFVVLREPDPFRGAQKMQAVTSIARLRNTFERWIPQSTAAPISIEGEVEEEVLSPLACKCAILELLGVELKKRDLLSLLSSQCPEALTRGGVTWREYVELVSAVEETLPVDMAIKSIYHEFDPTKKGYITEDDFMAVFMSISPALATARGREIFRAADIHSLGKV